MTNFHVIDSFKGKYSFLSNFYFPCEVAYEGQKYLSVEHAYQAAKTLDDVERTIIRLAQTPGWAKKLGKKVTLRKNWNDIKLSVMEDLLRQKFDPNKHPKLAQALVDTGDILLVEENNWDDKFWGKCGGYGENHLGKLLMKIREDLIYEN